MKISAIARKEIFHILRDPFTVAFAIGMPVFFVTLYGFVIDFNVKNLGMSVYDGDKTQHSRQLIETFTSSGFFTVEYLDSIRQAISALDSERTKAALIINRGFEKDLNAGKDTRVQILLDGADNSSSGVILSYLSGVQLAAVNKLSPGAFTPPVNVKTRFLFNPELNSRWFVIPGLAVLVLAIIAILLTALTIAKEWENGSMELLLSTPVKPIEIIIGKIAPYTVLSFLGVFLIYLASRIVFGIPFRGSHLVFIAGCLLFLSAYLAMGLLISVIARKQQISMMIAIVTGLLPSLLLSGFVFPIESMPLFFRYFTMIFPARWFMIICRGVFLQGTGITELATPFLALIILNVILIAAALSKFRRDLEP
jgi:ABC-2 type transport system permease protein